MQTIEEKFNELNERIKSAEVGGGIDKIEKQHKDGKKTARERINDLFDACTFVELDKLVMHRCVEFGMADKKVPGDGMVTGYGKIDGRLVFVFAQDFTVFGGSMSRANADKVVKVMQMALKMGAPVIGLNDSGGARIQEGVESLAGYADIFHLNVKASGVIPQISAILGPCAGGAVYSPALTDFILMVQDNSYMFVTGPDVVKTVTHEEVTKEDLGGAMTHNSRSGVAHLMANDDEHAIQTIRELFGYLPSNNMEDPPYKPTTDDIHREEEALQTIIPVDPNKPYDMKEILARIVDGSRFDEYRAEYGKTVVCGYARIGGFAVGIVANQKQHQQQVDESGHKRIEFGGVIYTESAEKAARFIMDCNQNLVPLVFLHDVNGFMVGRDAEWSGIIKAGAKMVNAVSNSVVPKITVILGGSFGAGHYAMCGKAYDPRFLFAWPTARYAVMSGDSAAGTLVEIKIKQLERGGKKLSDEEKKDPYESVKRTYDEQTNPRYGAARLWIDRIIDPMETRDAITQALEVVLTQR